MNKILCALACASACQAGAAITVHDDDGAAVTLQKPAQRIMALAPHVTELLFAAGGGGRIVGTVNFSDYPEAAKRIPLVGDNREVDIERVIAMKPDLLVVWRHGAAPRQIEILRQLGIPMFHSQPKTLDGIADNLVQLGRLMGTDRVAQAAAADLRRQLAALAARYEKRSPVRMFYQVWDKPLYTLNGAHIVSDAIRLCGGENVFAALKTTAPVLSPEGVLQEDPEAIVGSAEKTVSAGGVNMWRQYPSMTAVRNDNLFALNVDLLNRAGPRMIPGAAALCEKLELARQHRKNGAPP
ncbi:cobalamin-binding protein [Janthinobacterium fluminis]|uniref:Cobalamin-binding protein n=1 Tax=Janthinobacterium fluminis TaxID=2987524 RepID=A0ABT5K4C8_9BURK|nr:cobalamin-binding protein [Janthinobacterium fluminis]MDC8759856.1 cobalamin-binding protein [Janthinobacterium fluminis]